MMLPQFTDNPFRIQLSFHMLIERYQVAAAADQGFKGMQARALLAKIAEHPELIDGITDVKQIDENAALIAELMTDIFPEALTLNEIKAISLPYQGLVFNYSERFKNILKAAGESFEFNIRDFDEHQFYVASSCLILNRFYGTRLDISRPLFYDIPDADGIVRHYRILYNADFLELLPVGEAPDLSEADISALMDNYDDLSLWKAKIPPNSWIIKGFAIMTLIDATVENAVSNLKSSLIGRADAPDVQQSLVTIFSSIYRVPDMRMGFTVFDHSEGKFSNMPSTKKVHSFLLPYLMEEDCEKVLCNKSYQSVIMEHSYFAVSDVDKFIAGNDWTSLGKHFKEQNVQSFILAPIVKNNILLGVLELVSPRKKELNSVNAHRLEIVMPYLVDTIDRKVTEAQNRIQAVIQNNYTTLHPSVYWKFRREALNYIQSSMDGKPYELKQIVFKDVFPLYGQVDIKDSSITRNLSVRNDLLNQLNKLIAIVEQLHEYKLMATAEENLDELKNFVADLAINVKADTEQYIQHYLETDIHPLLRPTMLYNEVLAAEIEAYFKDIDALTGDFHQNRRNYERTLSMVNEKLVHIADTRQEEIQSYFPHYYERFKTDGVEHNLYIGASIAQNPNFGPADLHRLRLWQLGVIIEMEIAQHQLRPNLPYQLGVASLILVFSTPIAIRFRMDEKHFDIDGAYNIRYEVIKKRIDKAFIKDTRLRITRQGKITIIYTRREEEQEYLGYLRIMQSKGLLDDDIEHFDVEDLQGVSGLKALRVGVLYDHNHFEETGFSYNSFYEEQNHQEQNRLEQV